ncbi:uncharacterized protein GGS22DRAFT_199174 [Annulohypoxylon maeteangense]|uniref:uncharacterized protein n=1 Tax=Annulohypoxylon maeteangense TaxID=1927788 RepID=UPI002007D701|nr:uncharacterized protein GGS22DRAFT_199174 [Annulohypoxylon maeteangense]KAI0886841.1 hypothetical protein GGS22DRAFT_199174 [Annulohypoxylon maeteangense]
MISLQARNSASGHWLSGHGAYSELTKSQCSSDPRLRIPDPICVERKTMWPDMPMRVRLLGHCESQNFVVKGELTNPDALQRFLDSQTRVSGQKMVYLVESFDPRIVEVLGNHFQLHPSLFVEHAKVKADIVLLPSSLSTRDHITLRYFEPVEIYQGVPGFHQHCHTTGRHIKGTRSGDKILPVGILRRKCSVWNRNINGISDTIVLCDPKVTHLGTFGDQEPIPINTCPFQGGYVNFIPEKDQLKTSIGPPRTSMLEDLTFYLTNHFHLIADDSCSDGIQIFINKIITGHYWELANFANMNLSRAQGRLSKQSDLTGFSVERVERDWSDAQSSEKRSAQYCRDIENVMLQLNIEPHTPTYARITDWADCEKDFQFLLAEFRNLRQMTVSFNASMTTLAGIVGNHQAMTQQKQSLLEAKRMKVLTFLGLVFIPMTYVCSLFSMEGPFAPGDRLFWVYFLVAIPLVVLVSLGHWILDRGYKF